MRIKDTEILNIISRKKLDSVKARGYKHGLGFNVANDVFGDVSVWRDGTEICDLDELTQVIDELTALRAAIEEVTGIEF